MSVVWIDGLDRTGKDTQCKYLLPVISPCINIHGYNCAGIDDKTQQVIQKINVIEELEMFDRNASTQFLCNRTHLGELVYGWLYRHYYADYIYEIEAQYQDKQWFKNSSLFVFVDVPENLIKREDGNSSNGFAIDNIRKEKELFETAFRKSCVPNKKLINIDGKSIKEVNEEILEFLENRNLLKYQYDLLKA